jgi:hypothetical protein
MLIGKPYYMIKTHNNLINEVEIRGGHFEMREVQTSSSDPENQSLTLQKNNKESQL